ncbi:unnamed protein product, partial [Ectocarpus fasciculatus]
RETQWDKRNNAHLRAKVYEEEVENRDLLKRASQHFVVDRLVQVLSEDICSLSRHSKENLDTLGNLESRVQKLRYTNMHGASTRPWADRQVDVDLKVDLSRPNAMQFSTCSKCNASVLKKVLDTHERFCYGAVESLDDQPDEDGDGADGTEAGRTGSPAGPNAQNENMKPCQHCRRPFRIERMAKHEEACKKKSKAIGNRDGKEERARNAAVKMAPRPPRNLKVIGRTCDQVALAWDPPILDGGAAVFEHEASMVSYSVHEVVRKDKYHKEDVTTAMDPVLTSRWCTTKPVAVKGFTLTGLKAKTHLVNISVRCQNEAGWSDPSEVVPEAYTEDPVPPSPPLFFRVDLVKSNRVILRWMEPLCKGGEEVTEYELTYADVVPKDNQAVTTRKIEEDRHHELKVPASASEEDQGDQVLVLRGLRASTVHKDLTLRAIGQSGMASAAVFAPTFTTLPPGNRQRIMDELRRARAATGGWIDTDFYKDFMQRENREEYIARLERDLESLPVEQAGEEDSDEEVATSQAEGEKKETPVSNRNLAEEERLKQQEELLESVFHGYKRRKSQFEVRLRRLHEQASTIEECEETRLAHIGLRAVLAQQLNSTQARVMELQAELDRLATFKGGHVNSSVLHGSQQRFPIKVLRQKLRQEFELGQASIARDKANLMEGTKTSLRAMQLKLKREGELKERIAAFAVFNKNAEKAKKLSANLQARVNTQSDEGVKEKAFSALMSAVKATQQERAVILNALVRMRMRLISAAFIKWHTGKHATMDKVEISSEYVIRGIGGRHLMWAEEGREVMEKELQVVMRDAAALRRDFTRMSLTNKQKKALEGSAIFHETELGSFVEDSEAAGLDTALVAQVKLLE